jgi:TRAP-type C4-dicarboxylate transport system permease small subunit
MSPVARARLRGWVPVLEAIGASALVVVMLVVLVDVVGRNLLNQPLPWGTELVEVLMAVLIFALYPVLAWRETHITVDLVPVARSVRGVQRLIARLLGLAVFGVMAWCVARQALRAADYGESSPMLGLPTAWVLWGVSAMATVTALAFLWRLCTNAAPDEYALAPAGTPAVLE